MVICKEWLSGESASQWRRCPIINHQRVLSLRQWEVKKELPRPHISTCWRVGLFLTSKTVKSSTAELRARGKIIQNRQTGKIKRGYLLSKGSRSRVVNRPVFFVSFSFACFSLTTVTRVSDSSRARDTRYPRCGGKNETNLRLTAFPPRCWDVLSILAFSGWISTRRERILLSQSLKSHSEKRRDTNTSVVDKIWRVPLINSAPSSLFPKRPQNSSDHLLLFIFVNKERK